MKEELEVIESTLAINECPGSEVGNTAHASNAAVSTVGEEYIGSDFFFGSRCGSNFHILFASKGTWVSMNMLVISTRKGIQVWCFLALVAISWLMIIHKLMNFLKIINPRHSSLYGRGYIHCDMA